jgi:N-acetylneuraminic acid mutarotase
MRCLSRYDPIAEVRPFLQVGEMNSESERYERWEPIAGLPEAPMVGFDCTFKGDRLVVIAGYAYSGAGHELQIEFDYVEAFKIYEEFSDP